MPLHLAGYPEIRRRPRRVMSSHAKRRSDFGKSTARLMACSARHWEGPPSLDDHHGGNGRRPNCAIYALSSTLASCHHNRSQREQ